MRYAEQASELVIPMPDGASPDGGRLDGPALERLVAAFHARHRERYGYDQVGAPVEVVSVRLAAIVRTGVSLSGGPRGPAADAATDGPAAPDARPAFVDRSASFVPATVLDRRALAPGAIAAGPAIIEQPDATTWVPPGQRVRVDTAGSMWIEREDDA
jgi:N-methylhydantoinase A